MKRFLTLILACLAAVVTLQAQTVTCHIDGPANVRQQANTKSPVMGSIKNGMVATVSHAQGNMWKIHEVHNPRGGSAYTVKAVGYYTHKQNLVFDMDDTPDYSGSSNSSNGSSSSSGSGSNNYAWMNGTWKYGPVQVQVTSTRLTIYDSGQKVYTGSYEVNPGSGDEGWGLVTFNDGPRMIIFNGNAKKLYFDVGKPMLKVK